MTALQVAALGGMILVAGLIALALALRPAPHVLARIMKYFSSPVLVRIVRI